MIFFTSPVGGGPPEVRFAQPVRLPPDTHSQGRCSVACKLLCIKHLTEIRVMISTTLKTPKALIFSKIHVARLWVTLETLTRVATGTNTVMQT